MLSNPPNAENQAEAKDLLAVAKKESISLPLAIVEQGGQKSIEAAKGDPKAWSVALDFVSYRYSLNMRPSAAATAEPITGTETTHYTYVRVRGLDSPSLKWKRPLGPAAQATRWERIGENLNSNVPNQPTRLFAVGGGTSLDGEHIRNVVFESVEIHYSGAPVILESVVFINCVFVFDNNDHGRKLSKTLLAESNVNYRAPA